jgi:hypothetical protein
MLFGFMTYIENEEVFNYDKHFMAHTANLMLSVFYKIPKFLDFIVTCICQKIVSNIWLIM